MASELNDSQVYEGVGNDPLGGWQGTTQSEKSHSMQTIGLLGGRYLADDGSSVTRKSKAARLREILSITSHYDILHGLTPESFRQLLEELGPTFVKAGQILSMRSEILPDDFCQELTKLRTSVDPMDRKTVVETLQKEYNCPLEEIFDSIDDEPLGSASVAQVHKARLVTGEDVAVKVQRPNVRDVMAQDISIMRSLARYATKIMSGEQFLDIQSVIDELWQSFLEETDFLVEARALEEFRHNNDPIRYVDCPKPYPGLCTSHVVVMDYMQGIHISDVDELERQGYDLTEIGTKLVENYAKQMLDDGFFHADPHPGNLVINEGKIVYLDLGIMGRLSSHDRMALSKMVYAVATHDAAGLKDGMLRFCTNDVSGVDHAHLLADLDAIISDFGEADLSELDMGAFFNSVVSMARKNGVELSGTVTMLARSLVTLEGVVDQFLPGVSIVKIITGHVRRNINPLEFAEEESLRYLREMRMASHSLLGAASEADLAMKMLTRGQLRMRMDFGSSEDPMSELSRSADHLTMGVIIAGLFIGSSVVYYARIRPVIFGVPVIGFVGYLVALFLGLWLMRQISKDTRNKR